MEITLTPEAASRVRAVLGDDVDLSPRAVPQTLARLAEEAPDLYSEVLDQLSGSDIRLDSERALHRRHRRTALRRAFFGWGEYESDAGDRLLAKRRVAAAIPVALAAVMLIAAGFSALLKGPHGASKPSASAPVSRPSLGSAHQERASAHRRSSDGSSVWRLGPAVRTAVAALPEPAPLRATPRVPPVPMPSLPPVPAASGPNDKALPPSIVYSRVSGSNDDPAPRASVMYARDGGSDAAEPNAPRPSVSESMRGVRTNALKKTGDRIAALLVTGIVVATGVPSVPVIAEAIDGSTWLGQAAAGPDGRVHISFQETDADQSSAGGKRATGVALEPERLTAGLTGRIVVRRKAAAAAAIGAVLQAVSDYMQALARAGQVSVTDGAAQVSIGGPAPAWTYAASRIADVLNPQASGAMIQTTEISVGTPCIILITGPS